VITRALGMQDNVEVDLQSDECQPGDVYVLCSDGLSGMITDREIFDVVRASAGNLEQVCWRLVTLANEHGGEDNITAVVIRVEDDGDRHLELSKTLPLVTRSSVTGTEEDTPPASAVSPAEPPPPPSRPS
jgi:protein phosphatase